MLVKKRSEADEECAKAKRELDFCTEEEKPAKQQKLEEASKKKELYSKRMHDMLAASVDNETEQEPSAPDDSAFGHWYHRLKNMSRADAKLFLPLSWTSLSDPERESVIRHHKFTENEFVIPEDLTHQEHYWRGEVVIRKNVPWNYDILKINNSYFFPGNENALETPYKHGTVVHLKGTQGSMVYMVHTKNFTFLLSSLRLQLTHLIFFFILVGSIR